MTKRTQTQKFICFALWSLAWLSTHSHAETPATDVEGEWLCHTPSVSVNRAASHYVSIQNGILQTDTVDTDMQLTPTGDGRYSGTWIGQPSTHASRQLVLQAPGTLTYSDHVTGDLAHNTVTTQCERLGNITQTQPTAHPPAWQTIRLAQAHPTQPALGYDQIYAKQARYRDTQSGSNQWKKSFDDWCQISGLGGVRKKTVTAASQLNQPQSFACQKKAKNRDIHALKTAVIGPGGKLYMTDGHHSLSSLWEAPLRQGDDRTGTVQGNITIPVRIQADYQHLNNASFWRAMRAQGYTWLQDPHGDAITPAALPQQFGLKQGLKDDPYRSLVYFTRGVGHQVPEDAPEFTEFHWATWLKSAPRNFDLGHYQLHQIGAGNGSDHGYLQAIHDAALLMTQAPATETIGASGRTAQEMGQLPTPDMQALQELATQASAPGKLTQALHYRQQHAPKD